MHTKFLSALMMLSVLSSTLAPLARADESVSATVEVNQDESGSDTQDVIADHSQKLASMDESEIKSRLEGSAAAADEYIKKHAEELSAESLEKLKSLAAAIKSNAEHPAEFKKNALFGLKRTGETALVSMAFAGSTVKQVAFLPLITLGGLIHGLSTDQIDKNLDSKNSFYGNPYAEGTTIIVEILVSGPAAVPFFFALVSGVAADSIGQGVCESKRNDEYAQKLCNGFNAYDGKIETGADIGASAVGVGIDNGVKFVVKGTGSLVRKIFNHKKKSS